MEDSNRKYITLSFVAAGILAAYVGSVILDTLARTSGTFARLLDNDIILHGFPVALGFICFFVLQFNPKTVTWADEVIVEVRKVVWPSQRDTVAMTIVVTFMLILSGVLLGAFDVVSNFVVNYIVGI